MRNSGIYIAYPCSDKEKEIYCGAKTKVNNECTKVGATKDFNKRKQEYECVFGKVVFIRVACVDEDKIKKAEKKIIKEIKKRYDKCGYAPEWFDTTERDKIKKIIYDTLDRIEEINYNDCLKCKDKSIDECGQCM